MPTCGNTILKVISCIDHVDPESEQYSWGCREHAGKAHIKQFVNFPSRPPFYFVILGFEMKGLLRFIQQAESLWWCAL